jgi:hypothetical protein
MDMIAPLVFLGALATIVALGIRHARRRLFLVGYTFPEGVARRLRRRHPQLTHAEAGVVLESLRDWFRIAQDAGRRPLSMPSRIVDDAWHELILDTRAYRELCRAALGRHFDHVPAEAMRTPVQAQEGIRRAWRLACALEHIDPRAPDRLPRLFALDAQLAIPGGFVYAVDCADGRCAPHCASAIGCASGCGGSSGDGGDGGGGCGGD